MTHAFILTGDCEETLRTFPDASIDAVVTDPPYGLSRHPDAAEVLRHWLAGDDYRHRGGGFMGKTWDSFVPGPEVWREVFRVPKPGGHLLAFFGTRTYDLGCMAIRLAGFQIRDQLDWLNAQGMPKSHNVAREIDRRAGIAKNRGKRFVVAGYDKAYEGQAGAHGAYVSPEDAPGAPWNGWGTALAPGRDGRQPRERGTNQAPAAARSPAPGLRAPADRSDHARSRGRVQGREVLDHGPQHGCERAGAAPAHAPGRVRLGASSPGPRVSGRSVARSRSSISSPSTSAPASSTRRTITIGRCCSSPCGRGFDPASSVACSGATSISRAASCEWPGRLPRSAGGSPRAAMAARSTSPATLWRPSGRSVPRRWPATRWSSRARSTSRSMARSSIRPALERVKELSSVASSGRTSCATASQATTRCEGRRSRRSRRGWATLTSRPPCATPTCARRRGPGSRTQSCPRRTHDGSRAPAVSTQVSTRNGASEETPFSVSPVGIEPTTRTRGPRGLGQSAATTRSTGPPPRRCGSGTCRCCRGPAWPRGCRGCSTPRWPRRCRR